MFRPHRGKCNCGCEKEGIIVVKRGLIKQCNEKKKKEAKKDLLHSKGKASKVLREVLSKKFKRMAGGAPLSLADGYARGIKKAFPKATGVLEIFKEIWNERPHICQVSGALIRRFDIRCFSHILAKSTAPKFALMKENIWLVTPEVHHEWEFGNRNHEMFDGKRAEQQRLKTLYYDEHTK